MLIFIDTTTFHSIHNYFNSLNNDVDSIGVVVVIVVAIEPLIVIYKPLSFNAKKVAVENSWSFMVCDCM